MRELGYVGDFCPNAECDSYGDVEAKSIIRYQCKLSKETFNERKGTIFYNLKTDEKDILEYLASLGEGTGISSINRAKGIKGNTILSFLREAAKNAKQVETILLNEYQIDGLWSYVRYKKWQ